MHLIWTLIVGFFIGLIAKMLMPGRDPGGFIITIVLGIAGSALAGWGGQKLHFYRADQPAGFLASIVGAMVLLAIYRMFNRGNETL